MAPLAKSVHWESRYNMGQVVQNGYPHLKMFHEALQIKRTGQGKPYSRADFDKWTWNYDVREKFQQPPPHTPLAAYLLQVITV
jgi:hypothetical protein